MRNHLKSHKDFKSKTQSCESAKLPMSTQAFSSPDALNQFSLIKVPQNVDNANNINKNLNLNTITPTHGLSTATVSTNNVPSGNICSTPFNNNANINEFAKNINLNTNQNINSNYLLYVKSYIEALNAYNRNIIDYNNLLGLYNVNQNASMNPNIMIHVNNLNQVTNLPGLNMSLPMNLLNQSLFSAGSLSNSSIPTFSDYLNLYK